MLGIAKRIPVPASSDGRNQVCRCANSASAKAIAKPFFAFGEARNSEMISTEGTPAIRPEASATRRVLSLALEQVGEGVAHDVVEVK